ncbi:MAG: DEAD/DEAH box helicase [Bacteroidales bacterium]|nr:DEAD/DEAH box helicase [Bacteroidales bacterium]
MKCSDVCQVDRTLRDYQQDAKNKIFRHWDEVDSVLYQMPTGTGKTRLFTSLIRDVAVYGLERNHLQRILIIAHRSELIEQISASLSRYHLEHGILAGIQKERRDLSLPLQVASIQTLTHPGNSSLAQKLGFDYVIIDEAHHALATSYRKLWSLFPEAKILGVTATPWRMNRQGFTHLFEAFVPSPSVKEFIQRGWLAPYQYYSIPSSSMVQQSVDGLKEMGRDGDYKVSELERVMDRDSIRSQLYESYEKLVKGKKGIIYSISRLHSEHICWQYQSHGVRIKNIDSETPAQERKQIVEEFKRGMLDVIVNVDIFSEGFDCPDIEFVQLARPTKSLVKYLQQVGRGLRKNGDKRCAILDNVGMYRRFGLPDSDFDWQHYYEGEEGNAGIQKISAGCTRREGEPRVVDMREGDEEMVMVQDAEIINLQKTPKEEEMLLPNQVKAGKAVKSSLFLSGKYYLEDANGRYSIINSNTLESQFLCSGRTYPGGSLEARRLGKDKMVIKRLSPRIKGLKLQMTIIGYLEKHGNLWAFCPFLSPSQRLDIKV